MHASKQCPGARSMELRLDRIKATTCSIQIVCEKVDDRRWGGLFAIIICRPVWHCGKLWGPLQISMMNHENMVTKMCYFTNKVEYQVLRNE